MSEIRDSGIEEETLNRINQLRRRKQDVNYYTVLATSAKATYQKELAEYFYDKGKDIETSVLCFDCGDVRDVTQKICDCKVVNA